MLEHIVEMKPVWKSAAGESEVKILRAEYPQKEAFPVIWVGIYRLHTPEELTECLKAVVACMNAPSCDRYALMFEHTGASKLEKPDGDYLRTVAATLLSQRAIMQKKLMFSLYEAQDFDTATLMMRDLFLTLYTPIRPLLMSDDREDIEEFVREQLEA